MTKKEEEYGPFKGGGHCLSCETDFPDVDSLLNHDCPGHRK